MCNVSSNEAYNALSGGDRQGEAAGPGCGGGLVGTGFRFTSPGKRISFAQPFGVSRRGSPSATIF
jgi:hypothetical protein